ncbi:MAG: hypothetical protein ACYDEX_06220 [Mobilitalea sp.]
MSTDIKKYSITGNLKCIDGETESVNSLGLSIQVQMQGDYELSTNACKTMLANTLGSILKSAGVPIIREVDNKK